MNKTKPTTTTIKAMAIMARAKKDITTMAITMNTKAPISKKAITMLVIKDIKTTDITTTSTMTKVPLASNSRIVAILPASEELAEVIPKKIRRPSATSL